MPDIIDIYEKLNLTPRTGQIEYGKLAAGTLRSKPQFALAEGETGVGRTLGYLIPAMLHANETGQRVLITVATKAKLKQVWENDVQNILPLLSGKIKPAILKERFSYVCLRKFYNCINNPELYLTAEERVLFFAVITWQEKTKDGDLNEALHYNRSPILWKKIACEPGSCMGAQCEHFAKCKFQNAKKDAENSNLLLVQHHLFLQDLNMDFAILPHCEKIIFDDAHRLPKESPKVFGRHLYFYALRNAIKQNVWCKKWDEQSAECEKLFMALVKEIQNFTQKAKKRKYAYNQNLSSETGISPEPLQNALRALIEVIEQAGTDKDYMQFASDIRKISSDLAFFFTASRTDEYVYWIDSPSNPLQLTFNAEPINASAKWSKTLYPAIKSAFFTSDTISINGQFDYLTNRLALFGKNAKARIFTTEKEHPEVLAAEFLPKPVDEKFSEELTKTLCEIVTKNKSHTLIFTDMASISKLRAEMEKNEAMQSKTCFFQGSDGNFFNLAGFFQKTSGSILIGTPDELKSLEEMDLPENTLIVISRLPFPDMTDPLLAKRMEIIKEQGKNGFMLSTMPETSLTLRRIYSAILRSNKKQKLLLLDNRITSEMYGAKIQKLFPNFKTLSHRIFSTSFFEE